MDDKNGNENNQLNGDDSWMIKDGRKALFDTRKCMQHFDIDDDTESDEQKDQAMTTLVSALKQISKSSASLKRGLNGAVM